MSLTDNNSITPSGSDPYHLLRFVEAQDSIYGAVREELKRGSKTGHWMWFIFPQIAGLGTSAMARRFAISSTNEACGYLLHPVLGPRLGECSALVLAVSGKTAHDIFGSPDDLKFRSSMTLFAHATPENPVFKANIQKYFDGKYDRLTVEQIGGATSTEVE